MSGLGGAVIFQHARRFDFVEANACGQIGVRAFNSTVRQLNSIVQYAGSLCVCTLKASLMPVSPGLPTV